MNLKTMFGLGLIAFGSVFAQDSYESTAMSQSLSEQELQKQEEQAAASQDFTAPVPFVAPAIPSESKRSPFNRILHGKSYNRNSNMAAANNTDLLLDYPNLFANRKFFYIEPTNMMGILSLGSFFTAYDNSNATDGNFRLGRLTLGYAAPGFGFYIRAGLGRNRIKNDGSAPVDIPAGEGKTISVEPGVRSTTYGGDDLGFAISKGFMGLSLSLSGDWLTKKTETHIEPDAGAETKDRFDSLSFKLNMTNAPSAKNFTWTVGASFASSRNETLVDDDVDESKGPRSFWDLTPYVRGGVSVLENENARVLFGAAAIFNYRHFYDPKDEFSFTMVLQPSMMGEVFIGESKNFMFYGEVGYDWVAFDFDKNNDNDTNQMTDIMQPVVAALGFRYQYKDFLAVELGLGQQLFSNAGAFFNGDNTFIDFSAMIRF